MGSGYDAYSTRVLVVLIGASPAVYSETLFELSHPEGLGFLPTRIVLVTTSVGAAAIRAQLLEATVQVRGHMVSRQDRLFGLLGLTDGRKPAVELLVPKADDGSEIDDAHSEAQLGAIGDELLALVNEITSSDESALVLSLSGGRKGMSHLAGQVMSACARAQDRLVHVAVEPPWLEQCPDFFHPDTDVGCFEVVDAEGTRFVARANQVRLDLSFQPFWRMRKLLHAELAKSRASSFRDLVARFDSVSGDEVHVDLVVDLIRAKACLGGQALVQRSGANALQPPELAYLALLAEQSARDSGVPVPMGDALARRVVELHDAVKAARAPGRNADTAKKDLVGIVEQVFSRKKPKSTEVPGAAACNANLDAMLVDYVHIGDTPDISTLSDLCESVANDRSAWQRSRCARLNGALERAAPATLTNDHVRIPTGVRQVPAVEHRLPAAVQACVVSKTPAGGVGGW